MYPVVFLSYDEPNADANYQKLKEYVPEALRVHGVKGSDAAHKAAAALAKSHVPGCTHVFTVDADNQLIAHAWNTLVTTIYDRPQDFYDHVLSWRSINIINGLCYGNGGLKLWPIQWIEQMQTHEASSANVVKVDFCWDAKYTQLESIVSTTHVNGSPEQAFRAGYREGIKMTLMNGQPQSMISLARQAQRNDLNIQRLIAWSSIGADVPYGDWAMLGTMMGFWALNGEHQTLEVLLDHDTLWEIARLAVVKHEDAGVGHTQSVKPAAFDFYRENLQKYGIRVPKFGAFQSRTCKMLMDHRQSRNMFLEEVWNNRISSL